MKNIKKSTRFIYWLLTKIKYGRNFKRLGYKVIIFSPMQIDNPSGISIGNNVFVAHNAWLMGSTDDNAKGLVIGDGTVIGHNCHITALKDVVIEKNVLIADKIFISDCTHEYIDISIPIKEQLVKFAGNVYIGEGSWLGENVCVCSASIGKHCIVGANSVVTQDIPDYSVAVGSPAKVIKKYCCESNLWKKIN